MVRKDRGARCCLPSACVRARVDKASGARAAHGRDGHARVRSASVSVNSIVRPRPVRARCRLPFLGLRGLPEGAVNVPKYQRQW
eukprot:gene9354-biopygen13762